jgi:hypothetical protein
VAFLAAASAGIAATAIVYQKLYGSPTTSGYGDVSSMFTFAHVPQNVVRYFRWFAETQGSLALLGVVAILLPSRRVWPWVADRWALVLILACVSLVVAQYLAYLVFDEWTYLRFLLTAWPFVMLGVATLALWIARSGKPLARLASGALVLLLGIQGLHQARVSGVFLIWETHRRPVDVARRLREALPPGSVVYSLHHSGSLRHYGGLATIRTDVLNADWLDRSVSWLRERGHAAFLLLEDWEVGPFEARFAGQSTADTLERRLMFVDGPEQRTRLYDLSVLDGERPVAPRIADPANPRLLRSAVPDRGAFAPQLSQR